MNFQSFRVEIFRIENGEFPDMQIFGKKNKVLTYVIRQLGSLFILNRKVNYITGFYPLPVLKFERTSTNNSIIKLIMFPKEIILILIFLIGFFFVDAFLWLFFFFLPAYVIYNLIFHFLSKTLQTEIELLLKNNGFITE